MAALTLPVDAPGRGGMVGKSGGGGSLARSFAELAVRAGSRAGGSAQAAVAAVRSSTDAAKRRFIGGNGKRHPPGRTIPGAAPRAAAGDKAGRAKSQPEAGSVRVGGGAFHSYHPR